MEPNDISALLARVDERTLLMREEMHKGLADIRGLVRDHVDEDEKVHAKVAELEELVSKGKGAWGLAARSATVSVSFIAAMYYILTIFKR